MYRFKSGKFAGKRMEQIMLRSAPRLYEMAAWAKDKPHLQSMLKEFNRLRKKLNYARIYERCRNCKKRATWMTFPLSHNGKYSSTPDYFCNNHGPSRWEYEDGTSNRLPLHLDAVGIARTNGQDKFAQRLVHRGVLDAIGIEKGKRRTESFANAFFKKLGR